jgi:hypothetical protein
MESQKWELAVVLMLGVCLVPFCLFGSGTGQPTFDQKTIRDVMKVDQNLTTRFPDEKLRENMKGSLAHQVAADFDEMKSAFEENRLSDLVILLGRRRAVLTAPGFEQIPGAGSAEFWRNARGGGATLRLVPVNLHISGAMQPKPDLKTDPKGGIENDAVAVVIFEFHVVSRTPGATSHNDTGLCVATYLHKTGCPWG